MGFSLDILKKQQEQKKSSGPRFTWSPKEGKNVIRILPIASKDLTQDFGEFAIPVQTHYNVGPNKKIVQCPNSVGRKCTICANASALWKRNEPGDQDIAKQLFAKKQHLLNIIDLTTQEDIAKGVQTYAAPDGTPDHPGIYMQIVALLGIAQLGDIFSIETGRNIIITRSGSGKHSNYQVIADYAPSDVRQCLPVGWEASLDAKPQEWMGRVPSDEDIEKLMMGEPEAPAQQAAPAYSAAPAPQQQNYAPAAQNYAPAAQNYVPAAQSATHAAPAAQGYGHAAPAAQQSPAYQQHGNETVYTGGTQAAAPAQSGNPVCFGKQYSPTSQKCVGCPFVNACASDFYNA